MIRKLKFGVWSWGLGVVILLITHYSSLITVFAADTCDKASYSFAPSPDNPEHKIYTNTNAVYINIRGLEPGQYYYSYQGTNTTRTEYYYSNNTAQASAQGEVKLYFYKDHGWFTVGTQYIDLYKSKNDQNNSNLGDPGGDTLVCEDMEYDVLAASVASGNTLKLTVKNSSISDKDPYTINFKIENAKSGYTYFFFPEEASGICNLVNAVLEGDKCGSIRAAQLTSPTFEGSTTFNEPQAPGFGDSKKNPHKFCVQEENFGTQLAGYFPGGHGTGTSVLTPIVGQGVTLGNAIAGLISSASLTSALSCTNDETHATAYVDVGATKEELEACVAGKSKGEITKLQDSAGKFVVPLCNTLTGQDKTKKDKGYTLSNVTPIACGGGTGFACKAGQAMCVNVSSDNQRGNDKDLLCAKQLDTALGAQECDPKGGSVGTGIATAIGCIPTEPQALVQRLLTVVLAASGGIALLLMAFGAIEMMTSMGNAEKVKNGQERFTSAVIGLLFIIFSVLLLKIIGVDILDISGFG